MQFTASYTLGLQLIERDLDFLNQLEGCCISILKQQLGYDVQICNENIYLIVKLAYFPWFMTTSMNDWHCLKYPCHSMEENKIFCIRGTLAKLDSPDLVL